MKKIQEKTAPGMEDDNDEDLKSGLELDFVDQVCKEKYHINNSPFDWK